jgi:hypothetical protein
LDSSTANLNLAVEQRPSNTQHSHEEDIEQPIILDSSGSVSFSLADAFTLRSTRAC